MDVEWLILADAAQVVSNKLYLLGGGWDRLTLNRPLPTAHQMAVAASFRVPWTETNQKHGFEIQVADGDGGTIGKVAGNYEVGRPAGLPPGQDQRFQIAVSIGMQIRKFGTYVIVASLNGQEGGRFPFTVAAAPASAGAGPPPQEETS